MGNLLEARNLTKRFATRRRHTEHLAVNDVSLDIDVNETVALVGESGAGKSTTARLVLQLLRPDSGTVRFAGAERETLSRRTARAQRRHMQAVFQDPYSCFDPRRSIGASVAEPLLVHTSDSRPARTAKAAAVLERVGLGPEFVHRHPRQLSGGQLQRAAIARALVVEPKLIVCDEPVAALDVSVRAQVLNLMEDLRVEFGVSYLLITHDLSIVGTFADRVYVMCDGRVVESGSADRVLAEPREAYTKSLVKAAPQIATVCKRRLAGSSTPVHVPAVLDGAQATTEGNFDDPN